jgi:hypothetical protein
MSQDFDELLDKFVATLEEILKEKIPNAPAERREALVGLTREAVTCLHFTMLQGGSPGVQAARVILQLAQFKV